MYIVHCTEFCCVLWKSYYPSLHRLFCYSSRHLVPRVPDNGVSTVSDPQWWNRTVKLYQVLYRMCMNLCQDLYECIGFLDPRPIGLWHKHNLSHTIQILLSRPSEFLFVNRQSAKNEAHTWIPRRK